MTEFEAMVRSLLGNAAARRWAVQRAEPEVPSVDYRTGFAAGKEAGEVAALALVLAALTGESIATLIEEAQAQAAVESAMPFDLRLEVFEGGAAEGDAAEAEATAGTTAVPDAPDAVVAEAVDAEMARQDLVPCPTCWLPADVLPPLPHDDNARSRCPRGHENTLVPAVLDHLRSLMGPELGQSAS